MTRSRRLYWMKAAWEISYPSYLHLKVAGDGVAISPLMRGNSYTLTDKGCSDPYIRSGFFGAAVVQWNHACFGVREVFKRTGLNPVHGPSVGWDSSFGATVSYRVGFEIGGTQKESPLAHKLP
ncbi:hypothetical protein E2C01_057483 [Portunus trituberculatus]|uniref:Uncharacterized protein n=1 Tax=Portunus trituberculatus TaxID=210409 RepID=A0A5B7H170_PORTR|nr:hypothetical protein [Portunus trituberculatus]